MTDYIQWLLEEEEDSLAEETASVQVRIPRQKRRRLSGLFGIGPQRAEAAGRGRISPEEIRRKIARETDGSLPGEEIGRGEADYPRLLGRSKPIWQLPAAGTGIAAGEEAAEGAKGARVLGLYSALRKAGRTERLFTSAGAAGPAVTVREAPAPGAEALGPLELDRCFEREARRYDNGFSLL